MATKRGKIVVWLLFIIYLLFLVKIILFKYPISLREIFTAPKRPLSYRIGSSNFIPFRSISQFLFKGINIRNSLENLLGNIIAFGPLGFLLPMLTNKMNKFKFVILSAFVLSLIFEIIQLLTSLGEFDVNDIILNVIGGALGYLFYKILPTLWR